MQTLRIDGYIGKDDGMSVLFGQENFSLKSLTTFLDALPTDTKELKIEINSGGGSVTEGFAIHDKLVSTGMVIHTEVLGLCGSIATVIALAAKPENRSMHANSEYFIHNPFWQPMAPDALEADDLQKLADELRSSEERILNFYAQKTGQKANKLESFMERATSFTAKEAEELGFVSQIIGEAVEACKYRIAAFVDRQPKEKIKDMDFTEKQKSWIEKQFAAFGEKFNKMFTPVFKNMLVILESGGQIWIDSEDEDITGKSVFNVDADGNKTNEPAPDGDYVTKDGRTIVVKDGKVSEVKEKTEPVDETAALKATIADLTAQLETEKNAKAQVETAKAEQETQIVAMKKEFVALQNMVLGKEIPGKESQDFKGGEVKKDEKQAWLEANRKKYAQKTKA